MATSEGSNAVPPIQQLYPFLAVIGLGLAIWALVGQLDRWRIRGYLSGRNAITRSIRWHPFGPGWFGEKNATIYSVRYTDRNGEDRVATCKTSLLAGVYFTDDREDVPDEQELADEQVPPGHGTEARTRAELIAENQDLRAEIAGRLRRRHAAGSGEGRGHDD